MRDIDIRKYLQDMHVDEVKKICRPLQDHFGLSSFVYRKNYLDGTEINISNQPEWVEHFYTQKDLIKESIFDKHPDHYQSGFVLWSQLEGHQEILARAKAFHIDHGITIVRKVSDGIELCYFGTRDNNPSVVNNYLNNLDLLERFVLYFKSQAADIIKKAERNKLVIVQNKYEIVDVLEKDIQAIRPDMTRDEFIKATELKKYYLDGEFQGIVLSTREMEVIRCLLKGMTSEETGKTIFLSARTVEDYLSEIRAKFDVKSKSQLIKKLLEADFTSYIPHD
jgi:DNA-binding CsgD family transcriptional regulator